MSCATTLCGQEIVHSIAHPLYRVNDRLTLAHVEKLLVLFNRFESLNGMHDGRANGLVRTIFGSLTREMVEDMAERHRLAPLGPTPWKKSFTGGSDDHGGHYIATTFTETPAAAGAAEYLAHLRAGGHQPGGDSGGSLRLMLSLYTIADDYHRRQFPFGLGSRRDPFAELLRRVARTPGSQRPPGAAPRRTRRGLATATGRRGGLAMSPATAAQAAFAAANRASRELATALFEGFSRMARRGRLSAGLAAAAGQLAPLAAAAAPYLVAAQTQHKDDDLLAAAALRFLGQRPVWAGGKGGKKAWFTDTLTDVNGVARTIRTLAALARERGRNIAAITCGREAPPPELAVHCFEPVAELPIPGYEVQTVALPPFLEVLEHCEREQYGEILISTPGPLGLLGLAAGKLLGIPTTGIYHTDFPLYVRHLAGSTTLEEMTWAYMRLVLRPDGQGLRGQPQLPPPDARHDPPLRGPRAGSRDVRPGRGPRPPPELGPSPRPPLASPPLPRLPRRPRRGCRDALEVRAGSRRGPRRQ
ncbi:MAG TPA: glycosyltransferase [Thermoanaerobaculia bacterium]|nr:glycosyltransferase [Thermoanaerobaculia bacterium]